MKALKEYKKNITSQYGEDGIIEEIFNRIGTQNLFCIEFGAWDGKYLSNVWNLWQNNNWRALLIEADSEKCNQLKQATVNNNNVFVHQAYVAPTGDNSVGNIVVANGLPKVVDLLSIDIDGNDYYIFKELQDIQARVVIIEYNPTIPPHLEMVQEIGEYFGSSALALHKLARSKGYKLVAITDTNLFFVLESEFHKLGIEELDLSRDFLSNHLTYIYTSYDGLAFVDKVPSYMVNKLVTLDDEIDKMYNNRPKVKRLISFSGKIKTTEQKWPKFNSEIEQIPIKIFKTKR